MSLDLLLALIAATAVLVVIPGPNVALIIANTIAHGFRFGAATVLGTTLGILLQLCLVVIGLSALLQLAADALLWIKWAGVLYLLFLGIQALRQGFDPMPEARATDRPVTAMFWQGLFLAVINPKTLLFGAAFLPQFVSPQAGGFGLIWAASVYLGVIFVGDLVWVAMAQSARGFVLRLGQWRHRLTGGFFLAAGLGLAVARSNP
ncbi:LysE family translocator [Ruegeria sp. 2205SS24-7]|uniref:LysE family translocator n=1 Tax=Ruegeria discodermiae TaxID=3064389 RepID=UPI0027423605|nr:LysE family translocator [Ruegeria sp. 2205SS24-7]MDP5218635.1 LysE family translocator [Ruegeria sp. 2205SS24-7]